MPSINVINRYAGTPLGIAEVQHAIEEPAKQVQQFQLSMQFHGALGRTFALDEDAHVLLGGDDGPDEAA